MNKKPTVSVIIPTYNRAHLIGRAINSVLNQTYQDFEIIVIDDGSTDKTKEVVKNFQKQDKRIRYIWYEKNKGGSAARNIGIRDAKCEYIAFLDSDDEWMPKKIEKQVNFFVKCSKSVGVIYCLYYSQEDSFEYIEKVNSSNMRHGNVYNSLLNGWCPSSTSFFILKTQVFKKSGLFDESLSSFQDYDLWIRIAQYYEFEFVEEYLAIKHNHGGSQIAKDLKPRLKGLYLFLKKWGDIIKKEAGVDVFNNIQRIHLSAIYHNAVFNNLLIFHRKEAIKYLKLLWKMRSLSLKDIIKVGVILLGGPKLFKCYRCIWIKMHQIFIYINI
ncbi:Undecaprenyl-phosphate 4-deoxy-4-formamido-L-arabinose transferase [subsurface metagenome]